ncbi:hypothetical protein FDZ71_00330 [bacterium]|nr:MAG: hypothetical protein FDZ71_00330 [bacterium]
MDSASRACVACAAARVSTGRVISHIYDYSQGRHVSIGGTVSGKTVSLYDYERSCHFSGTLPSLYDYGRSCHVQLNVNGSSFTGYDYGSGSHFSGSVSGNSVSLYDYGKGQYFNYSV